MKKVIILLLMFSIVKAQDFKIDSTKYKRIRIEYGFLIPIGNLKTKFETSNELGLWYRTRKAHNDILDFGVRLNIPSNPQTFAYHGKDSLFMMQPKGLNGMLCLRMNKIYNINKNLKLEWGSSIGYGFFIFDDIEARLFDQRNPPTQEEIEKQREHDRKNNTIRLNKKTYSKGLSALYLGQGLSLNYKEIGLHFNYNLTPYSWFTKRIDNDFGMSAVSVNLFYNFNI